MKKIIILLFSLSLAFACSNEIVVPIPDARENISYANHPKNIEYQKALDDYRDNSNSPGSIMLVYKPTEDVWIGNSGKSNLEHNKSILTTSQFRTGSVTKMFTAVVILKLVEQGRLSLEDKLSDLLPSVNGKIPQAEKITVRHLLAHLSGIIDPPNESLRYQADIINNPIAMYTMTLDETLVTYVYGKDLNFTPGSSYSYSNTNYWLLGTIAEAITGKSLQPLMDELIFTPLQLTNTYIEKRDDRNVTRGYADLYGNRVLLDVSLWDKAEGDGEADGGLISTAEDLFKFMDGLFGGKLISASTLDEMKKIQLPTCNTPYCEYGLGLEIWRTDAGTAYGHNGGLVGIEANVLYYENNGGISVLYKNNGNGSDKSWLDQIMK
ncbi:MAG TPA: serine hydrolase domain-containing protein [Cyclobacteriaceae bacterium]|nr:serine hydrolase domain-containing protein [Cyclobacteriaceae bacterium]HPW61202.1 serine hydrolase domain-containing protein [Cyclobacteriaceae bacterium]